MNKTFHPISTDRRELSDMHLQIRRMCHDLNAPIRAIHGFAEILQRREAEQLSERGNMYLGRMVAATHTMEQIVGRLHQYSRLATHEVKLKPVSIAQFTGEIISAHYGKLPAGASLQWQADQSLTWISDPVLLETILRELVENALLYTKAESSAQVNIAWSVERDRLVLTVSDAGIGIDPEYHQRVFDLFERLHSRDHYAGTGAGLTMVLKAVSLLGGAIALASADGLGTTVKISLPRQDGSNGHDRNATSGDETCHARFPLPNPLPVESPSPQSSPASGRGGERERLFSIPAGEGTNVSLRELHVNV